MGRSGRIGISGGGRTRPIMARFKGRAGPFFAFTGGQLVRAMIETKRQAPVDRQPAPPPRRNVLGTVVQLLTLLLLLAVLAVVVLVLLTLAALVNTPTQVAGGIGARITGVTSGIGTAVQNVTDPNHP